jgi:ABC-2 type transport system permease protein
MSLRRNVTAVARREYTIRMRTRSFLFGTLALVVGVIAIGLAPVIIRAIDQRDAQQIAVHVNAVDLKSDPVATLTTLLNASTDIGAPASGASPDFAVSSVTDLRAARQAVGTGRYAAVLEIGRSAASGDLEFTLYTNDNATGRTAGAIRQASIAIVIGDRLVRLGVEPKAQASLFAATDFRVAWADPARTDPTHGTSETIGQDMLAFGMTILIYMMIILYGSWIAMSVVEEKSSRVMEVILNAATPFQLLTGKVFGVGAVALTQYAALLGAGVVAVLAQGPIAALVLGGAAGAATALPEGLTVPLLLLFGAYGTLGFLLFSVLYAAAGSLVSRQEDVNAAVMPMTLISTGGYLVGLYAALGLIDIRAGWIVALSQVPLLSPFMMLGRITTGQAAIWEVLLSMALLVVSIVGALWLAARIYAAGVLLYGQRPGVRTVLHLVLSRT